MEIFENSYWKYAVFVQKIVGLWVFQSPWKTYIIWCYVYLCTLSYMLPLSIRIYNEIGINKEIVIENLISELYLLGVIVKLTSSIVSKKKLKNLYAILGKTWNLMTDTEELQLMKKCMTDGQAKVKFYSVIMILATILYIVIPLCTPLIDYIIPNENITRSKIFPIHAEYGINIDKYYYLLFFHLIIGGPPTILLILAFDLGFMFLVQNVVALFTLVCFRLNKVSKMAGEIENHLVEFTKGDQIAYIYLVNAINLHKLVISYVNLIEDCYNFIWVIIVSGNLIAVGSTLALVIVTDELVDLIRYSPIVLACYIHLYCIFYTGQKIIDSSSIILYNCYTCKWYNLSKKSMYLIKIMMLRSLGFSKLTGGHMFNLCMNTYCSMMRSIWSVFTLISKKYK